MPSEVISISDLVIDAKVEYESTISEPSTPDSFVPKKYVDARFIELNMLSVSGNWTYSNQPPTLQFWNGSQGRRSAVQVDTTPFSEFNFQVTSVNSGAAPDSQILLGATDNIALNGQLPNNVSNYPILLGSNISLVHGGYSILSTGWVTLTIPKALTTFVLLSFGGNFIASPNISKARLFLR